MAIQIGAGISVGGGISIAATGGTPPPGPSGSNGVIGLSEMTATGNITNWLQGGGPGNATMTTDGFIITGNTGNDPTINGVNIASLTANNQTFFSTYGTGNKTVTWGAGSTFATSTVLLQTNAPPAIVFFIGNVSTPATFNFPITFS